MVTLKPLNVQRWLDDTQGRDTTRLADLHAGASTQVRRRAALLPEQDRLLLEMLLVDRAPVRRIGRALDLEAGQVSRRGKQLQRRIFSAFFDAVINASDQLTSLEQRIVALVYVARLGAAPAARMLGVTPREVRRATAYVFGWYRGRTGRSVS